MKLLSNEEYEPYGPEWEKEVMTMPKKVIVGLFKEQAKLATTQQSIIERAGPYLMKFKEWNGKLETREGLVHFPEIESLLSDIKGLK